MSDTTIHDQIADWLARLRDDAESIPWIERQAFPRRTVYLLMRNSSSSQALAAELLELLACDPKWEVRKAVADTLQYAPQETLAKALARLRSDDNTFVRRAAESALDRKRVAPKPPPDRRSMSGLSAKLARLNARFGARATRAALQIGEMYYDELVGATAHDARGLLTPLTSRLDRLLAQAELGTIAPEHLRQALRRMHERVRLLERLVDDMHNYALIASPLFRPQRLADILNEAVLLARDAAQARGYPTAGVVVDSQVPKDVTVEVSRDWVLLAFVNVIQNAFESFEADDGGSSAVIRITTAAVSSDEFQIMVQDNGCGMCSADVRQVLEFLPGNTSKKNRGTGFGLPTARRRIDAHNGTLAIESKEGVGTKVTITLPREQVTQDE